MAAVKRAATTAEAQAIVDKVERDMQAAAGVALRAAKVAVHLTVTPKEELTRKARLVGNALLRAFLGES